MTALYYDRQGNPCSLHDVARIDHRVARTEAGGAVVSTVWLAVPIGAVLGRPLIFETLVLGGPLNGNGEPYATEPEAVAGHERWVERAREAGT